MKRRAWALLAAGVLLGSTAHNAASPALANPLRTQSRPVGGALLKQSAAALQAYLRAAMTRDYGAAFAMLTQSERAYFHSARNFASVFESDRFRLRRYTLGASIGNDARRVVFVKERFSIADFAHNRDVTLEGTLAYGVVRSGKHYAIKDAGHPRRAMLPNVDSGNRGAEIAVRKVSFFNRHVQLLLTFVNRGKDFLTILPYRKSVLKDEAGVVYGIIEVKDWRITDRQLFLGLRLAGNAQYTGFLTFRLPARSVSRALYLEIAPLIREKDALPFSVSLPAIDLRNA